MTAAGEPDATGATGTVPPGALPTAVELFVYYRVPAAQAAAALATARDCQQRIRAAHPGLIARLLRRPEPADEHETWMETYRLDYRLDSAGAAGDSGADAGIDPALQSSIEAHAQPLARFIAGPRHVERFTACA